MKRFFFTLLTVLTLAMTAQSKVGMLVGSVESDRSTSEKNAVSWFQQNYAEGVVLTPSTISTLSVSDVSTLWVMIDRTGINALPAEFSAAATKGALKAYVEAGGNLLLTNHATLLTVAVGRIAETYRPGIFGSGAGGENNDVWGSQPVIGNADGHIYDHHAHAIYQGMEFVSGLYERSIYPLIGSGWKMDHNCMWDLNAYGLAANPNVVKTWEELTSSTVLGTWNQVVDYCCAGIVDFEPTTTIPGRILAVGLAAFDWSMGTANAYQGQLQLFTQNCISYLEANGGSNNDGNDDDDETPDPNPNPDPDPNDNQNQGEVALLIGYDNVNAMEAGSEKNAATWFQQTYTDGTVFTPSTISTLDADKVKVLWVMADRFNIGQGWENLPDAFKNATTVNTLKSFVNGGGSLLLTNHATQLAVAVERIGSSYTPNVFNSGQGGQNNDYWGSHPVIGNVYDYRDHAIYQDMTYYSDINAGIYRLVGAGVKPDHNCMWNLGELPLSGSANRVKAWEKATKSTVLGTWNHVTDFSFAGIVDFKPTTSCAGRILAVGLAAYDWSQGESNECKDDLKLFTSNCINYLLTADNTPEEEQPAGTFTDGVAVHFNMTLTDGKVSEELTNTQFTVESKLPATSAKGLDGDALRFDGYSNYIRTSVPEGKMSTEALTLSVVLAAETYPMMVVDQAANEFGTVCGNLDSGSGFALQLSSQGNLRALMAVDGMGIVTVSGNQKLPRGQWSKVDVVFNRAAGRAELFLNGQSIGQTAVSGSLMADGGTLYIGKDAAEIKEGWINQMYLNTFCGLIDDITIINGNVNGNGNGNVNGNVPDFAYPLSRYTGKAGLWRPRFHGMPTGSWSNETHGMLYSGGRYHVFFQKNPNGPYMSRLHWGHISSDNLYSWREEPIAVYPDINEDMKGCWSGCIYDDNGTPTILYTAVDNAKARIVKTTTNNADLNGWSNKQVVIDGRPSGLSDDFRDPYYFVANGQKYIIVGTGKDGKGACTLHRWTGSSWTNDGAIFFQGTNVSDHGTFWEMPNVTPMGNGKWLFTCSTLGNSAGTRTLCWVGTINSNGQFVPDGGIGNVQYLEMNGIADQGYGMLSPTIYQHGGKTLMMGIVPDKLPTTTDCEKGWSHNYSLPREVTLDANGQMVQKPYSGLTGMRTEVNVNVNGNVNGTASLAPVSGRQIELMGEFTVNGGTCGFRFLRSGNSYAELSYNASEGKLTISYENLTRESNGRDKWSAYLPQKVNNGQKLKLHLFFDGSIADVFVCDRWAFSVRMYPTDANGTGTEVFATTNTHVNVSAWTLDPSQTSETPDEPVIPDEPDEPEDPTTMAISMNDAGIMTYSSEWPLDFTEMTSDDGAQLTAYIVSGYRPSSHAIVLTPVTDIPANTGLLLKGTKNKKFTVAIRETDMQLSNMLVAVPSAETIVYPTEGNKTNYILANGSYGVDWYTLSEAGSIGANKAYLQLTTTISAARPLKWVFEDDDTTGIDEVTTGTEDMRNGKWYTLDGREVTNVSSQSSNFSAPMKKGIYIHNGVKVVIK